VPLRRAAGEDHDAAATEARLHDVADPLGERPDRDVRRLSKTFLASFCSMCSVGGLTFTMCAPSWRRSARRRRRCRSRSRPPSTGRYRAGSPDDDRGRPDRARLLGDLAQLLVHVVAHRGARIDRVADRRGSPARARPARGRDRRAGVLGLPQRVGVVQLEDQSGSGRRTGAAPALRKPSGAAYALQPESIAS
jgi:hypothetical protein